MKIKKITVVCAVASLFVFESCKSSQETTNGEGQKKGKGRPSVEMLMKEMDSDGDGLLSKKEVKGPLSNDFDKIDTNSDGFLSEKEINDAPKPARQQGGGMRGR